MKNILVTGGNGQLGRSLQKIAGEYPDYDFTFTDMPDTDITDRRAVNDRITSLGIDCIVNCAAYTNVEQAESDVETARRINADGPRILAEAALEHGIRLVHISTDYVFGSDDKRNEPYKETDATGPINVYGETKLAGEKAVAKTGCSAAIIRTSWLFSEFGNNFVKTMLRLAGEHDSLTIVDDQYGCPTYATDLARAAMLLAGRESAGCEIYNYCNSGVTNWHGFAEEIFRQAGVSTNARPVPHTAYPTKAERPAYSVMDTAKIRAIGAAVPHWKDALAECLAKLAEQEN